MLNPNQNNNEFRGETRGASADPDRDLNLAPPRGEEPTAFDEPEDLAASRQKTGPDAGRADADTGRHGRRNDRVSALMTSQVDVCTPGTELLYVAKMMADRDCGAIPVVESTDSMRPVGMITDRDIVIRVIAKGQNPYELRAGDCMSSDVISVSPQTTLSECVEVMRQHQVRRVLVNDETGRCIGVLSQGDIATHAADMETARLVRDVSEPRRGDAAGAYH